MPLSLPNTKSELQASGGLSVEDPVGWLAEGTGLAKGFLEVMGWLAEGFMVMTASSWPTGTGADSVAEFCNLDSHDRKCDAGRREQEGIQVIYVECSSQEMLVDRRRDFLECMWLKPRLSHC